MPKPFISPEAVNASPELTNMSKKLRDELAAASPEERARLLRVIDLVAEVPDYDKIDERRRRLGIAMATFRGVQEMTHGERLAFHQDALGIEASVSAVLHIPEWAHAIVHEITAAEALAADDVEHQADAALADVLPLQRTA